MEKAAPKPTKSAKSTNLLLEAYRASVKFDLGLLKHVASAVEWKSYMGEISMTDFPKLRLIAMMDLWGSKADVSQVAEELMLNDLEIAELREHRVYKQVRGHLRRAMANLSKKKKTKDWIEHAEDATWRQMYEELKFSDNQGRRHSAAREFGDRLAPKATRSQGEGDRHIHLDGAVLELIGKALDQKKVIEAGKPEKDVTPGTGD
jgi:hypothetical protein